MDFKDFRSWKAFKAEIYKVLQDAKSGKSKHAPLAVSQPIFRGHADARWTLESTLEREIPNCKSLPAYFIHILEASTKLLKKDLNLANSKFDHNSIPSTTMDFYSNPIPLLTEMITLRHHGFPCPLLDWSRSPYVAAFFAFADRPSKSTKRVAIYAYREDVGSGKSLNGHTVIKNVGHWGGGHTRHIRQQSQYTLAVKGVQTKSKLKQLEFCSHEYAIQKKGIHLSPYDWLCKYTLPISVREEVMEDLRLMNITPFSLFGDDDSLVKTVAQISTTDD